MADEEAAIRAGRHYGTNPLPALKQGVSVERSEEETMIRLALYSEAVGVWKKLTETRFALLALIPAVSLLAWVQLLSAELLRAGVGPVLGALICLAGLELVRSLHTYDRRNDDLYDDVISRARRIESELSVDTGLFLGRPEPKREGVDHSTAVDGIYRVSKVGWIVVAIVFIGIGLNVIG